MYIKKKKVFFSWSEIRDEGFRLYLLFIIADDNFGSRPSSILDRGRIKFPNGPKIAGGPDFGHPGLKQ